MLAPELLAAQRRRLWMLRPSGFQFRAVRDDNQRAITLDPGQQALDERLCGWIAPVRVLQQEQDGGAIQWRYQERLEDFEGRVLALGGRYLGLRQGLLHTQLEQLRHQQSRLARGPSDALQHALDALKVFRVAQIPPQVEPVTQQLHDRVQHAVAVIR